MKKFIIILVCLSFSLDTSGERVRATVYHAVAAECNKDPGHTAFMFELDLSNPYKHRIIAVSRDLLKKYPNKTKVLVVGTGKYDGIYTVRDKMNKRFKHCIDILINEGMTIGCWNDVQITKIKMKTKEMIETFSYFYGKLYREKYFFPGTERQLKSLENFQKDFGRELQEDLFDFVCFQFSKRYQQDTQIQKVQLNWIFGKKAVKAYRSRTDTEIYWQRVFAQKYRIKNKKKYNTKLDMGCYMEQEKSRFSNPDRQFLHCHENFFSFSEDSPACQKCSNLELCKKKK